MPRRDFLLGTIAVAAALSIAAGGSAYFAAPAQISPEPCTQCKFLDCLKGMAAHKRAVAAGYDALAARIANLSLFEGQPVDEVTLSALPNALARLQWVDANNEQLRGYEQLADDMIAAIGSPQGCGAVNLVVETNSSQCETSTAPLQRAQASMPCRELADLLERHEVMHLVACEARKARGTIARVLTPAGMAREEARAYRAEAAEIQKLIDEIEKKCERTFSGVSLSCSIPTPAGTVQMGQTVSGTACGDPVATEWTFTTESWVKPGGGSSKDDSQGRCVAKGSPTELAQADVYRRFTGKATLQGGGAGGWLCVYDPADPEHITIRNFRMATCSPNTEQTVTVPLARSPRECGAASPATPAPQPSTRPIS
jgi:hypothetical protein